MPISGGGTPSYQFSWYLDTDWDIIDRVTVDAGYAIFCYGPSGNGKVQMYNGAAWVDMDTAEATQLKMSGVEFEIFPPIWSTGGLNVGSVSVVSAVDNQDLKLGLMRLV